MILSYNINSNLGGGEFFSHLVPLVLIANLIFLISDPSSIPPIPNQFLVSLVPDLNSVRTFHLVLLALTPCLIFPIPSPHPVLPILCPFLVFSVSSSRSIINSVRMVPNLSPITSSIM